MTDDVARLVNVHLETHCEAGTQTVWRTLVDDIDAWWGEPYVSSSEREALTLEARPGGRLFEDWGNGNGTIWATVTTVRKPHRLGFDGTFMMTGAIHGIATITIEERPDHTTTVALTQQAIGAISDDTVAAWHGGWHDLLGALISRSEHNQKKET